VERSGSLVDILDRLPAVLSSLVLGARYGENPLEDHYGQRHLDLRSDRSSGFRRAAQVDLNSISAFTNFKLPSSPPRAYRV